MPYISLSVKHVSSILPFFFYLIRFFFLFGKAIGYVLFNQTIVGIPFAAFGYWMMYQPTRSIRVLPTFSSVLLGE